jgi:chaperonin GroEL (HSP60 family)
MKLAKGERVVCAWAERASGPGWSNFPVWVILEDYNGKMRRECLQPDEQTAEILLLRGVSEAVHDNMKYSVEQALKPKRKTKK